LIFILSFGLVSCSPSRLIAFNETYQVWMSAKDAIALESSNDRFMDITNFQNPKIKNFNVDPIPTRVAHEVLVKTLSLDLESGNLKNTITELSNFYTRYYNSATGKQAADWVFAKFTEYSAARGDIDIEYFEHPFLMPSVIARIRGSQGDKGATRVILGGHEDSVGRTSTGRSPGADDDASGTATVLEVFRVLAQSGFRPQRTIEFHAYSGEEGGLLGSQAIAKLYSDLDIVVESMLQLDMTMYGANQTQTIGVMTDYVDPALVAFLRIIINTYSQFPWENTKCGYGCSDHASWFKYGYRTCMPAEAIFSKSNPYIHTPDDLITRLNFVRGLEFAKIGLGYVVEMAGRSL